MPKGVRDELIDGQIYYMPAPSTIHQRLLSLLVTQINNYFASNGDKCEAFPAAFAVFSNETMDVKALQAG